MSKDWVADIAAMQTHYGADIAVAMHKDDPTWLREFYKFRFDCICEELNELAIASDHHDADGVVDAHIDLCVFAIGNLFLYGVDPHEAWDRILAANMQKEPGVKPNRPNPLGLPDLIKPTGWVAPTHYDNIGLFKEMFA